MLNETLTETGSPTTVTVPNQVVTDPATGSTV